MTRDYYLLDTHALLFWQIQIAVSEEFIAFLDTQEQNGTLYVSAISFWEIALLVKKGKLALSDIHAWKNDLLHNTNLGVIEPTAAEMIDSTLLPDHHKDPFDRLLIAQARQHNFVLITRDQHFHRYDVKHMWM